MFMNKKSISNKIICSLVLLSFMSVSCNIHYPITIIDSESKSSNIIVSKIQDFKRNGLLDCFNSNNARYATTEDELNELDYFFNNTEECVLEIEKEKDGDKILEVLNLIYGEGSIGEVYDSMCSLSSELADEYEESMVNIYNETISENENSIDALQAIRNIKLSFCDDNSTCRADLSKSYNWTYVNTYIGASASAIAGLLMYKFGGFWTRIAGLVAGGAGITAMGTIMIIWQNSIDWQIVQNFGFSIFNTICSIITLKTNLSDKEKAKLFISEISSKLQAYTKQHPEAASQMNSLLAFLDRNYCNFQSLHKAIQEFFNCFDKDTNFAKKTVTITAATASVAAVAYGTGFSVLVNGWMAYLKGLIPEWLSISLDGIVIIIKC